MAGRYEEEARREIEQQEGFRRWIADRITVIHATVTASDILQRNGVKLRYGGQRAEQIFCPFHGNSKTPAGRYHPADARKPDHVWCFVCNQQWDAITLFKKYAEYTGKFSGLLRMIERDYNITPPEMPTTVPDDEPAEQELAEVLALLDTCERCLKRGQRAFDLRGYLILGSVLDKLSFGIDAGTLPMPKARETMRRVLDKISEKVLACPDG
jgi:hypothetical protein